MSLKRDEFAKLLADALKQAGDNRQTVYEPEEFRLVFHEEGKVCGIANLGNFYDEYREAAEPTRQSRLRHFVRALLSYRKELPEDFADVGPDLRPMIRSRSYFELIRLRQQVEGKEGPDIPHQIIGDHLAACLAYDLPESIRSIAQDDLDQWGVSFYEAMEIARQNLEEVEVAFVSAENSLYASLTGDNYDASRLLLTDLIRSLDVNGEPIAVVPNRDSLLITGSDDLQGLTMMAGLAEQTLDAPRSICAIPLRLAGDEWVSWAPAHPLSEKFRLLELKSLGPDYAEQKELLDALHDKDGTDTFVASYSAAEKDGRTVGFSVWSEGVDTLLPRSQTIVFFRPERGMVAAGDWERVESIVGDLMVPTDMYPIRYRVKEFPTEAQLEAIANDFL